MAANAGVIVGREERWIQHYSSADSILLVGEGDFSFSLCLAMAFGSGTNIIATSLDSYDEVTKKYKNAKANLWHLDILGASLLHGVDATSMQSLPLLQCQKFHKIIYNFPHAGFLSREDDPTLIEHLDIYSMHRKLVRGFFMNAKPMLLVNGEIHISHKVTSPYNKWRIEDLASECALFLVECHVFRIKDYPGYENKRGAGSRCDEPFRLGECRTFKFKLYPAADEILQTRRKLDLVHKMPAEYQKATILGQHQPPPLERLHPLGYYDVPLCVEQAPNIRYAECFKVFGGYLKYVEETFGLTRYDLYQSVSEAVMDGFRTYMDSVPGATWSGYIGVLEDLHSLSLLRSEMLRQMLAST
ncbi:hypothetical protein F511_00334 [Dorcoceras hygrometricum]|nr:hypothetical protein F511_00334 [Dorcoceras hygrometricum]